jgi:acetyl esterase/lipase
MKNLFFSIAGFICLLSTFAQQTEDVILFIPEGEDSSYKDQSRGEIVPELHTYLVEEARNTRAAVLICPGGGYSHLASGHEGIEIADWFNSFGINAFVLHYRHSNRKKPKQYFYPAPLNDAKSAMRIIRQHAIEWGIDSKMIGVMGFSAGGHLASALGTHYDTGDSSRNDRMKFSCRPDFMILVYPVITFTKEAYVHKGSCWHLLGEERYQDEKYKKLLSNELHVDSLTPPAILIHSNDDKVVPSENSILFYRAMRKAGVPTEMHIYEYGEHGYG